MPESTALAQPECPAPILLPSEPLAVRGRSPPRQLTEPPASRHYCASLREQAYNQDLHPLNLRSEGASRRKAALLLMTPSSSTIRTNVYVDGFNLYYGAAKDTLYKWVNLADLCLQVMPGLTLNRIRYFTALVKPRPSNPQIRLRQEIYIRALETLPTSPSTTATIYSVKSPCPWPRHLPADRALQRSSSWRRRVRT